VTGLSKTLGDVDVPVDGKPSRLERNGVAMGRKGAEVVLGSRTEMLFGEAARRAAARLRGRGRRNYFIQSVTCVHHSRILVEHGPRTWGTIA
jgi:hypothetical protein